MARTDRQELEILRVSLARVAQALGVETERMPVKDKSFNELSEMAKTDRGWNALCAEMVSHMGENITIDRYDGDLIVTALREHAGRQTNGNVAFSAHLTRIATKIEADIARRK